MAPLAIHQHQRVVRTQAAKLCLQGLIGHVAAECCAVNEGTTFASAFMRSGLPAVRSSSAPRPAPGGAGVLVDTGGPRTRDDDGLRLRSSLAASAASCACSNAGVQANGASIVDLISQPCAAQLLMISAASRDSYA
jgi:hypothetical protein